MVHSTGGRRAWQRNYEQQRPSRSVYNKQLRQRRSNEIREYNQRYEQQQRVRPEDRLEYNCEYEQRRVRPEDRLEYFREYDQRRVRSEDRLEYNRDNGQQRPHIDRREHMRQWRQQHRDENAHSVKKMLLDVLDSSGSLITANSQRLRTLHDGLAKDMGMAQEAATGAHIA